MFKQTLLTIAFLGMIAQGFSFCGFYVAKTDASLFNESSQVILARSENRTVITMGSDYNGDVKEFAMVVPVPQLIQQNQIRLVSQAIFAKLDAYSGPRLVEYRDGNPCDEAKTYTTDAMANAAAAPEQETYIPKSEHGVTIEAAYSVGEYDIIVLSASQSDGLKTWLLKNGYKIPAQAEEVLNPYIKNKLKFFVVKVNLEKFKASGQETLRPIQMSYETDKFMLPIRLGMANAKGEQDMIVYAFSTKGRIECTNYRTVDIPTDQNIPTFVRSRFNDFYQSMFAAAWDKEGRDLIFNEYSWDLSSSNYLKCDPCAGDPPLFADLNEAGAFWVIQAQGANADYEGDVFFTRLHVRYDRKHFPQDLLFTVTPNKERFQGRYVMQIPAHVARDDCKAARDYLDKLEMRRNKELKTLASLTDWDMAQFADYPKSSTMRAYKMSDKTGPEAIAFNANKESKGENGIINYFLFGALGLALVVFLYSRFRA